MRRPVIIQRTHVPIICIQPRVDPNMSYSVLVSFDRIHHAPKKLQREWTRRSAKVQHRFLRSSNMRKHIKYLCNTYSRIKCQYIQRYVSVHTYIRLVCICVGLLAYVIRRVCLNTCRWI